MDEGDLWDLPTCPAPCALTAIGINGTFCDTTRTPLGATIVGASLELDAKDASNNGADRAYRCEYTGDANAWVMPPNGKAYGHAPNVL